MLIVLSLIGGLLLAGLALPVVGGLGWAAKRTNDALQNLPDALQENPLAQHSVMLAADGSTLAVIAGAEDRIVVPLDSIPTSMQQSIVAIEDNRFYEHKGVDVRSLLRAASHDSGSGEYAQGASTITQQYVKQVLLEAATDASTEAERKEAQKEATEKSIARKVREARYAIALEKKLTKGEILERYLNIAYFGEGVYGVGTAAQHYFGIPVNQLTLAQSALLAGLVNSPTEFDPVAHPKAAKDRRDLVLDADAKYGFISQAAVNAAKAQPVVVHPVAKAPDPCAASAAPFFCTYVLSQLLNDPALGKSSEDRAKSVYEGGLVIHTTYDAHAQAAVNAGIAANVASNIRQVMGVATIEPGTGNILAIGQNRAYGTGPGQSKTVYPAQQAYDVGSTMKIATLTAAIDSGLPLDTTFNSPACLKVPEYKNQGGKSCPDGVTNAGDSEAGIFNMVNGTWFSVNTYFVQLELQVGVLSVRDMAKNLGNTSPSLDKVGSRDAALTLGSFGGTSVIDMANMYATIAAQGKECDPRAITGITTLKGIGVPYTKAAACRQAISPDVANKVTGILRGVLTAPGATAAGKTIGRPAAGKTGTLDDYNGAWFVGYVPQFSTAIGIFDPLATTKPVTPITSLLTKKNYTKSLFGGNIPADAWQTIMKAIVQGVPVENLSSPQLGSPTPVVSATPTPGATGPTTSTTPDPSTGNPIPPPAHA
jgi:membrane peptidoglycan carboxypeptidase